MRFLIHFDPRLAENWLHWRTMLKCASDLVTPFNKAFTETIGSNAVLKNMSVMPRHLCSRACWRVYLTCLPAAGWRYLIRSSSPFRGHFGPDISTQHCLGTAPQWHKISESHQLWRHAPKKKKKKACGGEVFCQTSGLFFLRWGEMHFQFPLEEKVKCNVRGMGESKGKVLV